MDQMAACGHYRLWRTDLQLVRDLGLRYLRYGPPAAPHPPWSGPGTTGPSSMRSPTEMQRLGIVPIMDLCHFGLPDWLQNFQNPEVPEALADYARAFAQRYPWVRFYTPVNEMYVCAKLSALEGLWNEQCRDERAFVTAVRHLAKANVLMMQAIAEERPDAVFVNSESGEFYQPCCPDPEIRRIAAFENERRFLPLDLLYARPVHESTCAPISSSTACRAEEYAWFMAQDVRSRAILGCRLLRVEREAHRQPGACASARRAVRLVCHRRPVLPALSAADDAYRDQPHGCPRRAALALAAVAQCPADPPDRACRSWASPGTRSPTRSTGTSPCGNRSATSTRWACSTSTATQEPSALPTKHLVRLFEADLGEAPSIETVLRRGAKVANTRSEAAPCLGCCKLMDLMPARPNDRFWPAPSPA